MLQAQGIGPALRAETYTRKPIRWLKTAVGLQKQNKTGWYDENDWLERNPLWMAGQEVPHEGLESRLQCQGPVIVDQTQKHLRERTKQVVSGVGIACDVPGTERTLRQEYVSKGKVIREKQGPCGPWGDFMDFGFDINGHRNSSGSWKLRMTTVSVVRWATDWGRNGALSSFVIF